MNCVSTKRAVRVVIFASLLGPLIALRADDPPPSTLVLDSQAMLKDWKPPMYPEEARKAKKEGRVEVDMIVDERGVVIEAQVAHATDPVFEAAALEAVRQWRFEPALDAGKPIASGMSAPVVFSLAPSKGYVRGFPPWEQMPRPSETTPASEIFAPDPDYPAELLPLKLPGQVDLEVDIDTTGSVVARRVLWASHGAFVIEALHAASRWKFKPARHGLLAISSSMHSPATFESIDATSADICQVNGLQVVDDFGTGVWPKPVVMTEPVFPRERLLAGEEGIAEARFTIGENGQVTRVDLDECSAPEFGAALAAALETWVFRPVWKDGEAVSMRFKIRRKFHLPADSPLAHLVAVLNTGGIPTARGLDAPLEVIWRAPPIYPAVLRDSNPAGEAQVEFIIDRDGRARLPRVVSATLPEFGWAAATAVNQWVFAPPRRGGEPTEVRVRAPLRFSAKE